MSLFKPKREINVFHATALGLGALIGAGIFVLAGPALELAGPNVIFVYLLAGVSAFLSAFVYAELASTYLEPGNEYAFGKKVIGDRFAFLVAWLLISGSTVACAVYALGFAEFLGVFVSVNISVIASLVIFLVCLLNIVGVKKTASFEYYFTLVLTLALCVFGVFLLLQGDVQNIDFAFSREGLLATVGGVNLVYISFVGFQVIASATQEIKKPRQNIPRAIFASLGIAMAVYLFIIISLVALGDFEVSNPALILETAAEMFLGPRGAVFIVILGIIATLTSLNATVLSVSRRLYGVARDRYIPELLARIHPKFRTPYLSVILVFVIVNLLIFFGNLRWAANLSAFCYIASLVLVHVIALFSRRKHRLHRRAFRMPFFPWIPIVGIFLNLGFLFYMDPTVLVTGLAWTVLGGILFALLKRREAGVKKVKLWYERVKLAVHSL